MIATKTKTDRELLTDYFTEVVNQINEIATEKGMRATGQTLDSLEQVERPTGRDLYANPNIIFMEDGRGPTSPNGPYQQSDKPLHEIIEEWIEAKGLDLNPYAVANTIHKKGTKLFRAGGKSGVLSIPLNDSHLQEVFDQITLYWLVKSSSDIYEPINNQIKNERNTSRETNTAAV